MAIVAAATPREVRALASVHHSQPNSDAILSARSASTSQTTSSEITPLDFNAAKVRTWLRPQ